MFVSFEVVRKCFESGSRSGSQHRGRLLEWFFGKKNIATLQVASCDCVAGSANFVCGATNATHCTEGRERGKGSVEGVVGVGVAKVLLWRCAGLILIYAACSTAQS